MKSADPTPGPWRPWRALQIPVTAQPFQRLVPLGWRGELLVICAGMLLSFLVAGFWYPYWRIADMDFWVVYNAFLLNVPLPQEYFDHPGYLTILLLSYWLRALHALGVVHVVSLSAVRGDARRPRAVARLRHGLRAGLAVVDHCRGGRSRSSSPKHGVRVVE